MAGTGAAPTTAPTTADSSTSAPTTADSPTTAAPTTAAPATAPPPTTAASTTAPEPTTAPETTPEEGVVETGDLGDVDLAVLVVDGDELLVAVADERHEQVQGLRGVQDLGDLDGMLFTWEEEVHAAFTMQDTLIPLDIAFFDGEGRLVDVLEMTPCRSEPCPSYRPSGPFAQAVEVPAGTFAHLPPDATLTIKPGG